MGLYRFLVYIYSPPMLGSISTEKNISDLIHLKVTLAQTCLVSDSDSEKKTSVFWQKCTIHRLRVHCKHSHCSVEVHSIVSGGQGYWSDMCMNLVWLNHHYKTTCLKSMCIHCMKVQKVVFYINVVKRF